MVLLAGCAGSHGKTVHYIAVPARRGEVALTVDAVRGYALSVGYREAEYPLEVPPGYRAGFSREPRRAFYEVITVKKMDGEMRIYLRRLAGESDRENKRERLKLYGFLQTYPGLQGVRLGKMQVPEPLVPPSTAR